jgi:hypothetical protein
MADEGRHDGAMIGQRLPERGKAGNPWRLPWWPSFVDAGRIRPVTRHYRFRNMEASHLSRGLLGITFVEPDRGRKEHGVRSFPSRGISHSTVVFTAR